MKTQILPDITRPDVGVVIVSEWIVGTPERQQATVEAWAAALKRIPWPEGLIAANLFTDLGGVTVLNYGQWACVEAYEAFARTRPRSLAEEIDRAVPGIERKPPVAYRLYRSGTRKDGAIPGCVVFVSVQFDGPNEERQRKWVDTVFEALGAEAELPAGGISAHFHLSTDGTRVLNYAEWTDEESHRKALERSGQGTVGIGPKWREVQNFPGLISAGFKRYHFARSLVAEPRSEAA